MVQLDNKNIWIASSKEGLILECTSTGKLLRKLKNGTKPAWTPVDLIKDKDGNIIVADNANHRLVKLSQQGNYLGEFDLNLYLKGFFRKVRTDDLGRVYILSEEPEGYIILRFDKAIFQ